MEARLQTATSSGEVYSIISVHKLDDLMVHKEHDQHGIVQQKGKCSVSITYTRDGAALGHTAINVTAGKKAPGFAFSTNLTDEQCEKFMKDTIDMFYEMNDDMFIATTKIIIK